MSLRATGPLVCANASFKFALGTLQHRYPDVDANDTLVKLRELAINHDFREEEEEDPRLRGYLALPPPPLFPFSLFLSVSRRNATREC